MQFEILSDIGRKRAINEDSAAVFTLPEGLTLAVIADGMGGHLGGDFASSTAIKVIGEEFLKLKGTTLEGDEEWTEWLKETIFHVNLLLYEHAQKNEEFKGMGTTLEAVLIRGQSCLVAHIGDSRVYAINTDGVQQITKDHSYVNVLVDSGEITKEEAAVHPQRNLIMQALGSERTINPDFYTLNLEDETYLLICTDGLSNEVAEPSIQNIVVSDVAMREKVEALVDMANKLGGEDNISVILLKPSDPEVTTQ